MAQALLRNAQRRRRGSGANEAGARHVEEDGMLMQRGIGRREMLLGASAATVASALPLEVALGQKPLVVGFIYVGPRDDYGYNQAHAEAAAVLKKMPGVKVVEEEKVPETVAVEKSMESMINLDGATLLFPTSFGYFDPHMLRMAQKFPKLQFRHCGGLWTKDKHPANTGSYFGYIDECQYLNGVVAGHVSKSGKLGFVAAKPIPQVLRNINAFTLGAKSVNPNATTQVIFTGDWSLPVKEAEATNSMVAQGVDVVTCHVDSPKVVVETAERAGIHTCGYHANQSKLAPKGYLTGAEWNWEKVYTDFVNTMKAGGVPGNFVRGGLREGFVKTSPYGKAVPEKARAQHDAIKGRMLGGDYAIFKGPLKDNKGNTVIAAGTSYLQTEPKLESMNYLIEGVLGATS
jgi:simple sugar transport system substrate-binding protein